MRAAAQRLFLSTDAGSVLWPPPHGEASAYQAVVPSAALRGWVGRIHLGHEWVPPEAPVEERVLPDGPVHLTFNLGDRPTEVGGDGGCLTEVIGARCTPTVVRMAGLAEGIGVRLRPGGIAPLLGVPAGELAGRTVALDALRRTQ
jgi:hypothetical protein